MPSTGHGASGVAGGMRRRPIDVNKKLPLMRSNQELALDEDATLVQNDQEEDTINTTELQTKLKDIPVPVSLPQERIKREVPFVQTAKYIATPAAIAIKERAGAEAGYVDWDIDPAGYAFFKTLNDGSAGYSGPAIDEPAFERVIDTFEKAVKADTLPPLPGLEAALAAVVPDKALVSLSYNWWVGRRKQLAMPLVRALRPAPDPEDADVVCVAFRPRVAEGARRMRSNNKKTFTLLSQLHAEFKRLATLLELVSRRERLKLELHRSAGDYTEGAHRTLIGRLGRIAHRPPAYDEGGLVAHKPAPSKSPSQPRPSGGRQRDRDRDRDRDRSKKRPPAAPRQERADEAGCCRDAPVV